MPNRMVYATINSCEKQGDLTLSCTRQVFKHRRLELLSISHYV